MIHTSCSEAGTGSTTTCMHAGLIPIVSYETATDVEDFGLTLKDCSVDEIKHAIQYIANLPTDELKTRETNSEQWLIGWGYDNAMLEEGRHPTRDDLDYNAARQWSRLPCLRCGTRAFR